jgi:hypothetical protein
MALAFPPLPTPGERYPTDPGLSGITQYEWNNTRGVWQAVLSTVSLGATNQDAYNSYQWPNVDGVAGTQLTTDGAGNLAWDVTAAPSFQLLQLDGPFDGTRIAFTLETNPGGVPFIPDPFTNLVVFLGGVPQVPSAAYVVSPGTPTITFTEAPLAGTTFYAISNIVA